MKLRSLIVPIILGCGMLAASVSAQVSTGGIPPSFEMTTKASVPSIATGDVDVQKLLAEDEEDAKLGIPFRFGFPFDVHYDLTNSGIWEKLDDGTSLWRLRIECPGAYSTNLIYDDFFLPPGAKLYLYNDDHSMVNGAFTSQNNKETGEFATAPVKGSACTLELSIPAGVSYPGRLRISRIVHGYKDVFFNPDKDFGGSGSCNNNVHCPVGDPWANEIRAVAMITTSGGFRLCTGSMVNNARQDLTPYFLTANHCLGGEATWVFIFNYESPNCSNIDGPTWMSVSGSTLRATSTYSDFALLELSEQPPDSYNVYYGGWSAVDTAASSVVGIHHPEGDIKKISFDYDPVTSTEYLGTTPGVTHWRIGSWDDGTTEPGSSGSPIYDPNHHVVGQLHGGYASCTSITSDYYGKFSQSWAHGTTSSTQLKYWLDPDNTGVMMLDGRDGAGIKIDHTPLADTRDTINDYVVTATITSNAALVTDSLLLYYHLNSVWYNDVLQPTGNANEFSSSIPSQSPGTVIEYYLYAVDVEGKADTTDTYTFRVIDYGVTLTPSADSGRGAPADTLWYDLTVTNTGIYSDDYSLSLSAASWPTGLYDATGTNPLSSTGTLLQDQTFSLKARVIVPASTYGQFDTVVVTATSSGDNSYAASSTLKSTSEGSPLSVPVVDDFTSPTIDQGIWVKNVGGESNAIGLNEPSAPYSLNLDGNPSGADTLMSQAIDLSGQSNIIVRYFYEQTGGGDAPETGDDLYVEGLDSTGVWQQLAHHLGADPDMTEYVEVSVAVPPSAYHAGFRLRFRDKGTTGNFDDWFVDDVYVGEPPAYEVALTPSSQSQYGPSGLSAVYYLSVHNKGLNSDTYDLSAVQNSWAVTFYDETGSSVLTQAGPVAAADSLTIQAWVAVPSSAVMSEIDTALITATSINDPLASATALVATTSAGPPGGFPWYEPFPEASVNTLRWISNHGATISSLSVNPPSAPYAVNLDGGDRHGDQPVDRPVGPGGGDSELLLSAGRQRRSAGSG